jgi:hypothetical protein
MHRQRERAAGVHSALSGSTKNCNQRKNERRKMTYLRRISMKPILLAGAVLTGTAFGAQAQLADAIVPDPGFEPDWMTLGIASFAEPEEESVIVGGWKARDLDMIALQPLGANVECSSMDVEFVDGTTHRLPIDRGGELNEHRIYKLELQGESRNVTEVNLACRSTEGHTSVVQLYGIPDGLSGQGARTPY